MSCFRSKIISMLVIFVIVFSYMGQTLEAIATTDEIAPIINGFNKDSEMKFDAYFGREENSESIQDVNEKAVLTLEISPNKIGKGFLKEGILTVSEDANFKFSDIKNVMIDETEENIIQNETEEIRVENEISQEEAEIESEFVSEDEIIQNEITETWEDLTSKDFETEMVSNHEIKVQNIIYNTKIEVEIEYNKKENFYIADLYKNVNLKLQGTYINIDLERVEIEENKEMMIGWKYHKEIELLGEYTEVSPFRIGENTGTIVESRVRVKREIEEENYFPIKQTTLEIDIPEVTGKMPEKVSVQAHTLMASKGEDLGEAIFNQDNWNYDAESKKLKITVVNEADGTATNAVGEDEYHIVYRYNDYIGESVSLESNIKLTVEEYSANENRITTKELHNVQEIKTQENDLVTYNLGTTTSKLNKSKINANYNSQDAIYETEFTSTVNVNLLTSDLLEEFKINASKESYLDSNEVEFDAMSDIHYNKVKFRFTEIKNILQNDASIEIQNLNGDVLNTLTNENIQTEDDCEIKLMNQEKGLYVVFKNISVNGNISVEFTKGIGKSNYAKAIFHNFKQIKSYVSAELKYKELNEIYSMNEISTTKELEDSKTMAEINLANNNLNTIAKNDNVEVRIVLNNDKENTDLYSNPSFELAFPKYVRNVSVESVDLLYGDDLKIENLQTYQDNEIVKMRISLSGVQKSFCESVTTDGTNILLNLNIELDEYTPRKQDQIKLYYCNENVTNYQSQTKWTMSSAIPNGILRDTNGFDIAVVNYQGANGLVVSNSIINYDGQASKIKSVNQGEKTAEIKVNSNEQIAQMELVAMNNTKNVCSDVIFLGRVPFEGNTSVVSQKNMGTNITTNMLSGIQESIQNPNMVTIYYSTNEKATQNLKDVSNGWLTEVSDYSQIKSYMIVVKGNLQAGNVLKFTYDFKIPEGLEYGRELYGSFGGFYNNNQETLISYESSEADKVGLMTEVKPQLNVSVYPYGGNKEVYDGQIVTLMVKLENNDNNNLRNATLKVSVPSGTTYVEQEKNQYIENENVSYKEFQIEELVAGEITYFQFDVRVLEDSSEQYQKLEGYTEIHGNIQKYSLKVKDNQMVVSAKLAQDDAEFLENTDIEFLVEITNFDLAQKEPYKMSFAVPNYLTVNDVSYDDKELGFEVQDGKAVIDIGQLDSETILVTVNCTIGEITVKKLTMQTIFSVYPSNNENNFYSSEVIRTTIQQLNVQLTQEISSTQLHYGDNFTYHAVLQNESEVETIAKMIFKFPENLYVKEIKLIIKDEEKRIDDFYYNSYELMEQLAQNSKIELIATGEVTNMDAVIGSRKYSQRLVAQLANGQEIQSKPLEIQIISSSENTIQEDKSNSYSISGNVYIDKEELKTNDEGTNSQVQVQLFKDATMVKETTLDTEGNYDFKNLEKGDYTIVCNYDKEIYTLENETENGTSIVDKITIQDQSIKDVNLVLKEKDRFDFEIKQYITSASINIDGKQIEYDYDELELAKMEIEPSDLKNAMVKLKYKIVVTNVGNQEGKVSSIVDYLPNGVSFDDTENPGWSKGTIEGNIYYDGLKGISIVPGESQEISLILNKKITEDNLGVVSNKAQIAYVESETRLTEAMEGNFTSQETIITITQGSYNGLKVTITTISIVGVIGVFGYMLQNGEADKKFQMKGWIKKVYK